MLNQSRHSTASFAGCEISRKVVIAVGNGALASKCPEKISRKWERNYREMNHESCSL